MSESPATPRAVFLSYASQDAAAARRICDALRAANVEVWFDQSELRGGDAWDQKIRRQIKECALFVPVISPNTNARAEGYFRLEWKLAVDRSHLMADDAPFLFPVVIGEVTDATARVPEKFREVQWTRLRLDETPTDLAARVARLLGRAPAAPAEGRSGAEAARPAKFPEKQNRGFAKWWWLIFPLAALSVAIIGVLKRESRPLRVPAVEAAVKPESTRAAPVRSEARRLADQAFALSVEKYDSTLDDYTTADALMKRAVALDGDDGDVLARSAQLQFMFRNRGFDFSPERIALGRTQAESAVRLVPESAEAHLALHLALRYTGNVPAAMAPLRRAVELDPNHFRALIWLGSRLFDNQQTDEARQYLSRARQSEEWAPLVDYYEFLVSFGTLHFAEADKFIRRSFSAKPSANTAGGIAMLHLTWKGDLDEAARELSAVPPAMLNAPRVVWLTAQVQLNRRAPDEALRALDRLPDLFIRDSWFTGPKALLVGRAHALAGRATAAKLAWESGLRFVDEALKKEPAEAAIHRARGELLAALGRTEEALAEAQTFEELTRGAVRGWNNSAVGIYAALGRADLAVPKLAAILDRETGGWPLTRTILRQDPRWDPIRKDASFAALLVEPTPAENSGGSAASKTEPKLTVDEKSVAVLAFANLSDDKANEYFSDGISEELLNVLAKVPGLKVSARTSAFHFKGKDTPIPEIARQLGVAYVVEGSVRKAGDKVRITAQLIKAADGFHVWSDTFTRDLKDIFAVQDEISGLIAKNLSLELGIAPDRKPRPTSPEAYQIYLQARQAWNLRTSEGHKLAESLLVRSLALEPGFAKAHAALCDVWTTAQGQNERIGAYAQRDSSRLQQAIAKANEAIQLDPDCAEAYAALGNALGMAWRIEDAVRSLRRAVELNPNYATAHQWLGRRLAESGDLPGAFASHSRAAELDPLSHRILDNASDSALLLGRFGEAASLLQRAAILNPASAQVRCKIAFLLWTSGRRAEAIAAARALAAESETESREYRLSIASMILGSTGHGAEAEQALVQMTPYRDDHLASLAYLGRTQEVVSHLDNLRLDGLHWFLFDPRLTAVRVSPEFTAWMTRVGAADALARASVWMASNSALNLPPTP